MCLQRKKEKKGMEAEKGIDRILFIQRWLKNDYDVISEDRSNFKKLEEGRITLKQSKSRFIKSNKFPSGSEFILNDDLYKEWLNGLGYEV